MPTTTDEEKRKKRSAEEAHDELLKELCEPVGLEIVAALPRVAKSMADARARSYGAALAGILRHLDVARRGRGENKAWSDARSSILDVFSRQWVAGGIDDLPAPIELVISADHALSFPGGTKIRDTFKVSPLFLKDGGVDMYEFQLIRWDSYWTDSMNRIAFEVLREKPREKLDPKQLDWLEYVSDPKNAPKETNVSKTRLLWLKDQRADDWPKFVDWICECRRAVMMPRERRSR